MKQDTAARSVLESLARSHSSPESDAIEHLLLVLDFQRQLELDWGSPDAIGGLEKTHARIKALLDRFRPTSKGPMQIVSILLLPKPRVRKHGPPEEISLLHRLCRSSVPQAARDWRNTADAWLDCLWADTPTTRLALGPLSADIDEVSDLTGEIAVAAVRGSSERDIRLEPLTLSLVVTDASTTK